MAATETSTRANEVLDGLYREHVGDVYRYTYAVLGNHADAEDVTQTTFVNALRALERGEMPDEPSHWLTVIAHNLVRQRWRQAASRPALVELETDIPRAEEDEEAFELGELVRALQRIPETQREAIVMRELEGRSYREIATVMGLSTSALETLLFRARRSLAEELENAVTCEKAELALSKQLDGRVSRKDRRRLDEHLAECEDCARLAAAQQRRRRAFKGLALLPLPIGLALFKGAPSAAAANSVPAIGLGTAGAGTSGSGTAGTAAAGATTATSAGGATVGGSLAAGLVVKVAAVVVTATVAAGVGYKGVEAVRDTSDQAPPATAKKKTPVENAAGGRAAVARRVKSGTDGETAKIAASPHGKPVSTQGHPTQSASPKPALAQPQSAIARSEDNSAHAAATSSSSTGEAKTTEPLAPKHSVSAVHQKKASTAADAPKAPKGGKDTQAGAPEHSPSAGRSAKHGTPKPPVSGGSPEAPAGAAGGSTAGGAAAAPPAVGAAPSSGATGTASPPAASGPGAPATPTPPPSSTPPATTPPPTTPPATTPPTNETPPSTSTPPPTTPPPTEQTPPPPTQPPPTSPPGDTTESPPAPSDGSPGDDDHGHDPAWWTWWLWWLRHHGHNG